MAATYWRAWPDYFEGERVFVVGGGPSLRNLDPEKLRDRRVIAVNNAGLDLVPWADVLIWSDPRWFRWNEDRLHLHGGPIKIARNAVNIEHGRFRIRNMRRDTGPSLSLRPDTLAGYDTGAGAVNLAFLMGARDIVLLGFDMSDPPPDRWREGNYHGDHQIAPPPMQRTENFVPSHERMALALDEHGVKVRNATPGSALRAYEMVDLDDVLAPQVLTHVEQSLIMPMIGGSMLELGNKANARGTYKAAFERLGIRHVSVDLNGKDGALRLDLNSPLGLGRFDTVTNFGTSEHVLDQHACWENIIGATGRLLVCTTPAPGGWKAPHGKWYPTPRFYVELARLNGFRLDRLYIDGVSPEKLLVCARMERIADVPFVMPSMELIHDAGDFGIGEAA